MRQLHGPGAAIVRQVQQRCSAAHQLLVNVRHQVGLALDAQEVLSRSRVVVGRKPAAQTSGIACDVTSTCIQVPDDGQQRLTAERFTECFALDLKLAGAGLGFCRIYQHVSGGLIDLQAGCLARKP